MKKGERRKVTPKDDVIERLRRMGISVEVGVKRPLDNNEFFSAIIGTSGKQLVVR